MTDLAPPTSEIGHSGTSVVPWSGLGDSEEQVPELSWPTSLHTYAKMETDSQIAALLLGVFLPIRRYNWRINPNGAEDEIVEHMATDLNLPILGADPAKPKPRRKGRWSHDDHLRHALLAMVFGHMFFEQVVTDPRKSPDGKHHYVRISPRMPATLSEIKVASNGDLQSIKQYGTGRPGDLQFPEIKANRLVAYVYDRRGANWIGRALALDTVLPTPDGWRMMADLEAGAKVFGDDGRVRYVTSTATWHQRPCYRMVFSDGTVVVADEQHEWFTYSAAERNNQRAGKLRTTAEIAATVQAKGISNHATAWGGALDYPAQDLLVEPYVLGLWLGDGYSMSGEIAAHEDDVAEEVQQLEGAGYPTKLRHNGPGKGRHIKVYGHLQTQLRVLGLLGDKRVPEHYLRGSYEQRLALLQGLMDSDGTVGGGTAQKLCTFDNTNRQLIDAVAELVRSLGVQARIGVTHRGGSSPEHWRRAWHVVFTPDTFVPFRLGRKRERCSSLRGRRWHYIVSCETTELQDTKCIEVDSSSHMYLVGTGMIPTHNSLLRYIYRNWLIKDRLLRVDAIRHQRQGMGVPIATAPENASKQQIEELAAIAQAYKVGEAAGGALPHGAELRFRGVEGNVPDTLASIRYHDEAMAALFLEMFMKLGTTQTGSRALGESFTEFFSLALEATADWYQGVTQADVVEDLVDWNYGIDAGCPLLEYEPQEDKTLAVEELKSLIDSGAIKLDPKTEDWVRDKYHLPPVDWEAREANKPDPVPPVALPPVQPPPAPEASVKARRWPWQRRQAQAAANLPGRTLRRQPYAHEVAAATDYAALDNNWSSATDAAVREYKAIRVQQIRELADAVEAAVDADDLKALANLMPTPVAAPVLEAHMANMAGTAAEQAIREAQDQGVTITEKQVASKLTAVNKRVAVRADVVDQLLSRGLGEVAGREALRRAGGDLSGAEVGAMVKEHLDELSDSWLVDQLGGSLTAAQNMARLAVMRSEPSTIYASELLDANTCEECIGVDGTEYTSDMAAESAYPSGGYIECVGGPRCRGTLVATYDEATVEGEQDVAANA